jgi:protein-disulfide isomerase
LLIRKVGPLALALGILTLAPMLAGAQTATAPAMTAAERQGIETVIREYLLAHPETIVDALRGYEAKRQAEADQAAQAALAANRDAIERDPSSPSVGPANAKATVVQFFDYRCGYCKKVLPSVQELIKTDPNLRVVFKELPILGPDSQMAAQAAQAAWSIAPDKYFAFHTALMQSRGALDEARVLELAKSVGIDPGKLKTAMAQPAVKAKLQANLDLAQKLNISGTPAFVIGNELLPGAADLDTLRMKVAAAQH